MLVAFDSGDRRLTCTVCHDPHVPVVRDSIAYDKKCLSWQRNCRVYWGGSQYMLHSTHTSFVHLFLAEIKSEQNIGQRNIHMSTQIPDGNSESQ
jgi:hypothetical protein